MRFFGLRILLVGVATRPVVAHSGLRRIAQALQLLGEGPDALRLPDGLPSLGQPAARRLFARPSAFSGPFGSLQSLKSLQSLPDLPQEKLFPSRTTPSRNSKIPKKSPLSPRRSSPGLRKYVPS